MVHIIKMAVGIRDVEHLREAQRQRMEVEPPLRHRTRHAPKRAEEIIEGGSIYWVVGGMIQCRQRVLDIVSDTRMDGSACVALMLDEALVMVDPRPMRAFQGWRYLAESDAPADLSRVPGTQADLPPALRLALRELCLL
ncbi:DUF1489 family protein [Acidisoma cladoniae]|jgi:hypothetical protein|uniref:DUF1489 family protein n=1 Tax=Acidisoma cladoniae TaxID=3040935 RepID=UPI00254F5754|nr:DUF1489 domain-containing protein [Acidisoma sp. PAMC 29798]